MQSWVRRFEQGKSDEEIAKFATIFQEVQKVVDSKQLNPMIRTQYMRTAFQIPFDATVRVSLDTNLTMIKENPDVGPSCAISGRCARCLAGSRNPHKREAIVKGHASGVNLLGALCVELRSMLESALPCLKYRQWHVSSLQWFPN